jgi:exodeoxyribonuclease V alpha subunit
MTDSLAASDNNRAVTESTLRGEISRVVFESDDGAYCIIKVIDAQGVENTVTGSISGAYSGHHIEVSGHWETHKEYGRQLKASSYKFILPNTKEGIERYLSSGMIPGVGPKLAKCIVDYFGDKTLEIMDRFSARLAEIPGLGRKRVEAIKEAWESQRARRDIFIFMQGLGISQAYCHKIYQVYGNQSAEVVKQNPYRLADEVNGMGFIMSDRVSAALGVEKNSLVRIAAGIIYSLNQLKQAGHTCYPEEQFIKYAAQLLNVDDADIINGIKYAEAAHRIVLEAINAHDRMVYDAVLHRAESELPELIRNLLTVGRFKAQNMLRVPALQGQSFTDEQYRAVSGAAQSPLSIITGGPGVGKTTVIGELVRRAKTAKLKVYLAAPTGRAAQRLSESSKMNAKTIHRLLKWEPVEKRFVYGLNRKLPCDLLIVDEVSMLDTQLAVYLLRAVEKGCAVVLVGDADQLPSVGPGEVLNDLINSGIAPVTRLTQVFRQGAGSSIISNAHAVNAGRMPELKAHDKNTLSDFYWIEQEDPEQTLDMIVRMVCERIPERFGLNPMRDIQVLTPMNRGLCGTGSINALLQEQLNSGHKPQFKIGERLFKAGDRVMQTSNNYDKNVFNGDMGRIVNIDAHNNVFKVAYGMHQVDYEFTEVDQISLSYAITVHKSQGSEFPAVILPLLNQHYMMLQRNLLYTAMTRAKKLLVLIGGKKAVSMAVRNAIREPRHTLLCHKLKALNL